MTQTRLKRLSELALKNPGDPFANYGLAMEYRRQDRNQEAIKTFAKLMQERPDYLPTYFHYGTLLLQMGKALAQRRSSLRGSLPPRNREISTPATSSVKPWSSSVGGRGS